MRTRLQTRRSKLIAAAAGFVASVAILSGCASPNGVQESDDTATSQSDNSQDNDQSDGAQGGDAINGSASCDIPGAIGDKTGKTYVEQINNGLTQGPISNVYADNHGSPSDHEPLAFCQKVNVKCLAPNLSGSPSNNPGFYVFVIKDKNYYVNSAQFLNGGTLGQVAGSGPVDKKVPAC